MRAEKQETNQVPSAVLHKFNLKIYFAAYGGLRVDFLSLFGF